MFTVVGNDLAFQLSLFSVQEFILMAFLALLIGLTFSLQIYTYKKRHCSTIKSVSQGAATGVTGVFAGIVGTAFCVSCLLPLFAAIGIGSGAVFFILENNIYFVIGAIALMLVSLYFAIKKVKKINSLSDNKHMKTTSKITCPKCGFEKEETMPTNSCTHSYKCTKCGEVITSKEGDCCVFCSYGDTKCPSKQ